MYDMSPSVKPDVHTWLGFGKKALIESEPIRKQSMAEVTKHETRKKKKPARPSIPRIPAAEPARIALATRLRVVRERAMN